MRVFFPYDPKISRAMERIRQAFIRYAPPETEFLTSPTPDSIHIIHYIGQNPKEESSQWPGSIFGAPTLPKTQKYVIFLHLLNAFFPQLEPSFKKLMENALLVITHTHEFVNFPCHLYETSWGYDPEVFYYVNLPKKWTILTTGYMADAEAIDAVFDACYHTMTSMVHVGGALEKSWVQPTFTRYENVLDLSLRVLYNQARYVSGMRRDPGFELPVIEGYASGCQPICFSHPAAKRYFNDFAVFVPLLSRGELALKLMDLLKQPIDLRPNPDILKRFYWSEIMQKLWQKLLEV